MNLEGKVGQFLKCYRVKNKKKTTDFQIKAGPLGCERF